MSWKVGNTWLLVFVLAGLPLLLCSGMAALIAGSDFARWVAAIILVVYGVIAGSWLFSWLALRSGRRGVNAPQGRNGGIGEP